MKKWFTSPNPDQTLQLVQRKQWKAIDFTPKNLLISTSLDMKKNQGTQLSEKCMSHLFIVKAAIIISVAALILVFHGLNTIKSITEILILVQSLANTFFPWRKIKVVILLQMKYKPTPKSVMFLN